MDFQQWRLPGVVVIQGMDKRACLSLGVVVSSDLYFACSDKFSAHLRCCNLSPFQADPACCHSVADEPLLDFFPPLAQGINKFKQPVNAKEHLLVKGLIY